MYLSDNQILEAVQKKELVISDFDPARLGGVSYDVLLGNRLIVTDLAKTNCIDPVNKIFPKTIEVRLSDTEEYILHPGNSILAEIWDNIGTNSNILIQLSGKSSLARIGLTVHNTAGIINPGHFLNVILELTNLNKVPIILRPKMPIAQFLFSRLTSIPSRMYGSTGHYNENNFKVN